MFEKTAIHCDWVFGGRGADKSLEEQDKEGDSVVVFNSGKVIVPLAEYGEFQVGRHKDDSV